MAEKRVCRIHIPDHDMDVGVFATEDGLSEFIRASSRGDKLAAKVATEWSIWKDG